MPGPRAGEMYGLGLPVPKAIKMCMNARADGDARRLVCAMCPYLRVLEMGEACGVAVAARHGAPESAHRAAILRL